LSMHQRKSKMADNVLQRKGKASAKESGYTSLLMEEVPRTPRRSSRLAGLPPTPVSDIDHAESGSRRTLSEFKKKFRKVPAGDEEEGAPVEIAPNLEGEYGNIFVLLVLYFLQGVPMGLGQAVPLFLQQKGASMDDQALFKFVTWPYSIKLLWAPIVDAFYSKTIGKRKSWIVPVQIITGFMMIFVGGVVEQYLSKSGEGGEGGNITYLFGVFFTLYLMVATQDIAVDGWAISLLRKENIGYASTCNTVGQTAGYMTSYALFMALNSPEFCNTYLRWGDSSTEGMVSFDTFMRFWGVVFVVVTIGVWMLKAERDDDEEDVSLKDAYAEIIGILKKPNVHVLVLVLLTVRIGFAMTDSATDLQLVDLGVPKETLALLGAAYFPLEILFPFLISRKISGTDSKPLSFFLGAYPFRLLAGLLYAAIIHWTPIAMPGDKPGTGFWVVLFLALVAHRLCCNTMFVSQMAFFARVSDPRIGGTYMTLLNTLANLGNMWPAPFALKLLGLLEKTDCLNKATTSAAVLVVSNATCKGEEGIKQCADALGNCVRTTDGYSLWVVVLTVAGFGWLALFYRMIKKLEAADISGWRDSS